MNGVSSLPMLTSLGIDLTATGATHNSSCNNNQIPHTADVIGCISIPIAEILRGIGDWSAVDIRAGEQKGGEERGSEDQIDLDFVARTARDMSSDADWTLVGDEDDCEKRGDDEGNDEDGGENEKKDDSMRVYLHSIAITHHDT